MRLIGTQSGQVSKLTAMDAAGRSRGGTWNRSQKRSGGCWCGFSSWDAFGLGPNRDARVAAPQPMTMRRRVRWLCANMFLIPYPLGELGTGGESNDHDPG